MGNVFFELTVVICVAAFLVIVFRFLKQPAILAYILAGILLGPLGFFHIQAKEVVASMGEIGITLLLFLLALELRISGLRSVGKIAVITGVLQIVITFLLGYILSLLLGFSFFEAFYLAVALTFSSTIIIVKLLADRKELKSLHGKIAIGVLLLQDFFAIFVLVILSAFKTTNVEIPIFELGLVCIKGIALLIGIYIGSKYLPRIIHPIARSEEALFLFSLSFVFGVSALVASPFVGFPIEIGGFAAGVALANASENFQIAARIRALRDFFITLFFVMLGLQMSFENTTTILLPVVVFSLFVLFVKPLIVLFILAESGYKNRTSYLTGISFGQISEFSLIILFLGAKLGHVSSEVVVLGTIIGVVTFTFSSYCMMYAKYIYRYSGVKKVIALFEKKGTHQETKHDSALDEFENLEDHIGLIGVNRMGRSILDALKHEKEKVIVVDFDPDVVKQLKEEGVVSIFGDISDSEIQEKVRLRKAKHVISTVSDLEDNIMLVSALAKANKSAKIVVVGQDYEDAKALYNAGADYVVLPHVVSGKHLAQIIREDKLDSIHTFKEKDYREK